VGRKFCRGDDFNQFQIIGMPDFPVPDAGRLKDAGPFPQNVFSLAFVLEQNPSLGHIDHLEIELMRVPGAFRMPAWYGPDDMGAELGLCGSLDAKITVFKKSAQALALESATIGMAYRKCLTFPHVARRRFCRCCHERLPFLFSRSRLHQDKAGQARQFVSAVPDNSE